MVATSAVLLLASLALLVSVGSHAFKNKVVLQFDGSLRPPADIGFPSQSLGRIGTAAAAIIIWKQQDEKSMLWLGGKRLAPGSLQNSAEAEYESLLFGLNQCCTILQSAEAITNPNKRVNKILIQGDCKTVMDQLQQVSRPRKLESYYHLAVTSIMTLRRVCNEIEYQHLPRGANFLCDGLCNRIRTEIETSAYQDVLQGIKEAASKTELQDFLLYFGDGSLIPYSKRMFLYNKLAKKAIDFDDRALLLNIGQVMEDEASTVWSLSQQRNLRHQLQAQGVMFQLYGLKELASCRKSQRAVVAMEKKHRFLLKKYGKMLMNDIIFTTTTNNDDIQLDNLEPLWQAWLEKATISNEWKQTQGHWLRLPNIYL